jgi:hypothetical protein
LAAQLHDFLRGRLIPPESSSFERDPRALVGTVMVRVAKNSRIKCDDTAADNFDWAATRDFRKLDSCKIEKNDPQPLYSEVVKGDADAKLEAVIGNAEVKSSWMYELTYDEPLGVHVDSVSGCIDFDALKEDKLPERVCDVRVVVGAVLTVVTYKAFESTTLKADISYASLVKLGGGYAGEVQQAKHRPILSVDTRVASHFFVTDEHGYLNLPRSLKPEAFDHAVEPLPASPRVLEPFRSFESLTDKASKPTLRDFDGLDR